MRWLTQDVAPNRLPFPFPSSIRWPGPYFCRTALGWGGISMNFPPKLAEWGGRKSPAGPWSALWGRLGGGGTADTPRDDAQPAAPRGHPQPQAHAARATLHLTHLAARRGPPTATSRIRQSARPARPSPHPSNRRAPRLVHLHGARPPPRAASRQSARPAPPIADLLAPRRCACAEPRTRSLSNTGGASSAGSVFLSGPHVALTVASPFRVVPGPSG